MNPSGTNPSDMNPSPSVRRLPLSTLFLLGSLAVFVVWFLRLHFEQLHYEGIFKAGSVELAKKDTTRARSLFDAFIRANPTDPGAYLTICTVCEEFDQAALVVDYAQRGVDACKNASKEQRAQLLLDLSQGQALAAPAHPQTQAIASARAALDLDPQNPQTLNAVGYMLVDNDQNLDDADKLLRRALQALKPRGDDPLSEVLRPLVEDSFGWLLYKKGDYPGAVAALEQASHDMPAGEPASGAKYFYYHLGAAYRKAGRIEEARHTLDIALHYDPTFAEAKAEEALLPPQSLPGVSPIGAPPIGAPPINSSSPPAASPGLKL